MRWATDPEEQSFTDLMDMQHVYATVWWPRGSREDPKYRIETRIEARQKCKIEGSEQEGERQAEAMLRADAEAIVKELGGRVQWGHVRKPGRT